jgi:hypothetical protein
MHDSAAVSSKKINLISSDGEVVEVNYDVAVMSKTLQDAIEPILQVISIAFQFL